MTREYYPPSPYGDPVPNGSFRGELSIQWSVLKQYVDRLGAEVSDPILCFKESAVGNNFNEPFCVYDPDTNILYIQ